MGIMNKVTGGTDLTKPKASVGYIVGAVLPIVVLLIAFAIAGYVYSKVKGASAGVPRGATGAVGSVVGVFGNGT